jgi:hypothetical protein
VLSTSTELEYENEELGSDWTVAKASMELVVEVLLAVSTGVELLEAATADGVWVHVLSTSTELETETEVEVVAADELVAAGEL